MRLNFNHFTVDQIGATLLRWDPEHNFRLGYLRDNMEPQLVPHPNDDPAPIVWIHNDDRRVDMSNQSLDSYAHVSGVRARPTNTNDPMQGQDEGLWDPRPTKARHSEAELTAVWAELEVLGRSMSTWLAFRKLQKAEMKNNLKGLPLEIRSMIFEMLIVQAPLTEISPATGITEPMQTIDGGIGAVN